MAKINASFLAAAMKAQFNGGSWSAVGEPVSLKDIWDATMPGMWKQIDGDVATIVAVTFDSGDVAYRISVPLKGGDAVELKLSSQSELEEDDEVAIASIKGQLLRKAGYEDIVKYDGVLVDDWEGEDDKEEEEEEEEEEQPKKPARKGKKGKK